jgi:hypothetical protein
MNNSDNVFAREAPYMLYFGINIKLKQTFINADKINVMENQIVLFL